MVLQQLVTKILFCILTICTVSYSFSGRVIDERNNPVDGVSVTSLHSNQQTKTLQDGIFTISATNAKLRQNVMNKDHIRINAGYIKVSIINTPEMVTISRFDLSGRTGSSVFHQRLDIGTHDIRLDKSSESHGISVYRIRIGNMDYTLKTINLGKTELTHETSIRNSNISNKGTGTSTSALTSSFSDTLLIEKNGYLTKRVVVRDPDEELGNLRLYDTAFALTTSNFPKLDGSTTNVPLTRIICCKFFNCNYNWKKMQTLPSNYNWEIVPDSTDKSIYNTIMNISRFSKTPQSYDSLISGKRELIFVASAPSERHYAAAAAAGLDFDIRPFAIDALLMVVNKNTTVTGITTQNVKDIYTLKTTNWNQLGGPDLAIKPFQREETSGSQELMKLLIMKDTPIASSIPLLQGMISVFEQLQYSTNAISYTPYYYKEFQMRDSLIRSLNIDSIAPDRNSLYERKYPHCAEVLVVSLKNLSDTTNASKLRDWLLAPQGQKVVNESGYVPIRNPGTNWQ